MTPKALTTVPSVEYYDRDAASFGQRFSRTSFAEAHADWIEFLPPTGSFILDVGAGSGRDALALEAMGFKVTAVEPSPRLREWSERNHPVSEVVWLDDSLPALNLVFTTARLFDFVLCSAVLMHISPDDVTRSFRSLADLMTPNGVLAISLRDRQRFEPPEIFHNIDHSTVLAAGSSAGLNFIRSTETLDHPRRAGIVWRSYVFRKSQSTYGS